MSKRPSYFEPIEKLEEGFHLIAEGATTIAPTLVWTLDQNFQFETHLTQLSVVDRAIFCWCPKQFNLEGFMNELVLKKSNDCFFSVSLPRATIFFKSPFMGAGSSALRFGIPSKVFKVQRRQNLRHFLLKDSGAWVEFDDPLFPDKRLKRKMYDLSAGGLSFLIPALDAPLYPAGLIIEKFTFTINGRNISAAVEVKHTKPSSGKQKSLGTKVGISFGKIEPADSKYIASYVFDENRKMLSRFM